MNLTQWAVRNGVTHQALHELREMFGLEPMAITPNRAQTEAGVQSLVRLEGAKNGLLWRNNVGVLQNPETGQPIRYGLANDSKQLNEKLKSGDLIGWQSVLITPEHVGTVIACFTSRECKHPGWVYSGTAREIAQRRWAEVVVAAGGDACFVTGEGTL